MHKSLAIAVLATAILVPLGTVVPTSPVSAHHGWGTFDTRYAYYIAGTITQVRWGNPHSEVRLRVETTDLPDGLRERPLPPGADARNGAETLASARPTAASIRRST